MSTSGPDFPLTTRNDIENWLHRTSKFVGHKFNQGTYYPFCLNLECQCHFDFPSLIAIYQRESGRQLGAEAISQLKSTFEGISQPFWLDGVYCAAMQEVLKTAYIDPASKQKFDATLTCADGFDRWLAVSRFENLPFQGVNDLEIPKLMDLPQLCRFYRFISVLQSELGDFASYVQSWAAWLICHND